MHSIFAFLKKRCLNFFGLLFIFSLFFSCSKESATPPNVKELEPLTKIPDDVTKLFIEKKGRLSDTVILYSQGGPVTELDTNGFNGLNFSSYREVYVHQANTYNPSIIKSMGEKLTFEQAILEDGISVEMLDRVARYFKKQGKTIYIVGHSFGAFLIPALIASKENLAKKYLIAAGRLDMPEKVWEGFRDGKLYFFQDGITPVLQPTSSDESEDEKNQSYAMGKLQAGFGKNRYTQLLENKDLSNVLYAYGEKDKVVGRLTDAEITFLENKKATIYKVENGNHGSMDDPPHNLKLKKILLSDN